MLKGHNLFIFKARTLKIIYYHNSVIIEARTLKLCMIIYVVGRFDLDFFSKCRVAQENSVKIFLNQLYDEIITHYFTLFENSVKFLVTISCPSPISDDLLYPPPQKKNLQKVRMRFSTFLHCSKSHYSIKLNILFP